MTCTNHPSSHALSLAPHLPLPPADLLRSLFTIQLTLGRDGEAFPPGFPYMLPVAASAALAPPVPVSASASASGPRAVPVPVTAPKAEKAPCKGLVHELLAYHPVAVGVSTGEGVARAHRASRWLEELQGSHIILDATHALHAATQCVVPLLLRYAGTGGAATGGGVTVLQAFARFVQGQLGAQVRSEGGPGGDGSGSGSGGPDPSLGGTGGGPAAPPEPPRPDPAIAAASVPWVVLHSIWSALDREVGLVAALSPSQVTFSVDSVRPAAKYTSSARYVTWAVRSSVFMLLKKYGRHWH